MKTTAAVTNPSARRRSDILRAAYRVMASDGVHRAPLTRVAKEAGVSKGLLLYHFHTKDALVLSALEWVLNATADRIRLALDEGPDPAEAISVVIDAVWVGPERNRDFFRFYLDGVEHQTRSPEFDELGARARAIINGLYREVIESSTAAGALAVGDSEAAATNMRAIIEGHFLQWLQTDDWKTNHAVFRERCRSAVSALLAGAA